MKTLSEIETLIANRCLDEATAELETILKKSPDDAEARMLFGICGQLKGDADCFCRVYRELAPSLAARAESGEESPVVARWRHYLRVATYLVALGVISLTGSSLAAPTSGLFETNAISNAVSGSVETNRIENVQGVERFKNLPRGVQNIKYDENGVISTLVVVGKKAVPKALRHNPGLVAQWGGKVACRDAQHELTQFLLTKCKWGKTTSGQIAVKESVASNADATNGETSEESASFIEIEMDEWLKEKSAKDSVSNIQVLWEGLNDNGEYVWVGVWHAKSLELRKEPRKEPRWSCKDYGMGGRPIPPKIYPVKPTKLPAYGMGGQVREAYGIVGEDDDDFL